MKADAIFRKALSLTRRLNRVPTSVDLVLEGISRAAIRHHFGNWTILSKMIRKRINIKHKPSSLQELMKQVVSEVR